VALRVDEACVRFEAAWKAVGVGGAPPQIDQFLGDTPEPARSALLRELLALELAYRWRRAEQPTFSVHRLDPCGPEAITRAAECEALPARPAGARSAVPPDYELLEMLGRGGMGVVYRARQKSARRIVALKFLRAERLNELSPGQRREWLERFRTEARATARLEHENVVTVYEVGTGDDCPFYSMRYVTGRSLADLLRRGPVGGDRAAALMAAVARAVHFAHGHGILHRDLTPRNVLVDDGDRPYVADFGVAKWLEAAPNLTYAGDWLGTPSYMSPEQAEDAARVTPASDVYSLGATLYALLTGRPPFQAASAVETLLQVKYHEPVPPRQLNPSVPPDLETIALKCLHKYPRRRYRTAEELADELQRRRVRGPTRPPAARTDDRGGKRAGRQPSILLPGIVAALLAGLAISLAFQARLDEAVSRVWRAFVAAEKESRDKADEWRQQNIEPPAQCD
jgi:serine/threonine protein kinase